MTVNRIIPSTSNDFLELSYGVAKSMEEYPRLMCVKFMDLSQTRLSVALSAKLIDLSTLYV